MGVSGNGFILKVKDGASTFVTLLGQRTTTLNLPTDEADQTSKSSDDWHEGILTIRNGSVDVAGVAEANDPVLTQMKAHWLAKTGFLAANDEQIQVIDPTDSTTWEGDANMLDLTFDGAHDDVIQYSATFTFTDPVTNS